MVNETTLENNLRWKLRLARATREEGAISKIEENAAQIERSHSNGLLQNVREVFGTVPLCCDPLIERLFSLLFGYRKVEEKVD